PGGIPPENPRRRYPRLAEALGAGEKVNDAAFVHHTIALDDVRLHYVTCGRGDPIVLLHGWPQTWYEWRRIMPALAENYTVIAPDSRGMGDSERTESGYDASTLAEDAFSLVRSLGFQKVFLVGHDLGVSTAYAY